MKKQFIRACSWATALLLGSIAGACSSASKAAKTPEEDTKKDMEQQVDIPSPGQKIRVLYGVRVSDYEVKE